jgi:hypothetical protein
MVKKKTNKTNIANDARIIEELLELWDRRAMAADGDVAPTLSCAYPDELRKLYLAAKRLVRNTGG